MKNELLARAISELDDELLEEARRPLPKKKHAVATLSRWAAIAACFVIVLAAAIIPFHGRNNVALSIYDIDIKEGEQVELPLISAVQQRQINMTEIPLHISGEKRGVSLYAGVGSTLLNSDGMGCEELILSEAADVVWVVDTTAQDSFELRLVCGEKTMVLMVTVSRTKDNIVVTMRHKP